MCSSTFEDSLSALATAREALKVSKEAGLAAEVPKPARSVAAHGQVHKKRQACESIILKNMVTNDD